MIAKAGIYRFHMRTRIAVLLGAVLLVTACSPGTDSTTSTTPETSTTSSSTTSSTGATTTTEATTTTTIAVTTTTQQIDVTVTDGQVEGPGRFEHTVGDEVSIRVLSDTADEIHVHGYDVFFEAEAGVPIEVTLIADVPGIFEVELESSHTLLFELEVTP